MTHRTLNFLHRPDVRSVVGAVLVVWLFSGQGFRYLLGVAGYTAASVVVATLAALSLDVPRRAPRLLLAFVTLALASTLWSFTPLVTFAAALVLVLTTYLALAATATWSPSELLRIVREGLLVSVVGGLVFEVFVALHGGPLASPTHSFQSLAATSPDASPVYWSDGLLLRGGPIQGFVGNRNPEGALGVMLLALSVWSGRGWKKWTGIVAGTLTMALTRSATVTIIAAFLVILSAGVLLTRASSPKWRPLVSRSVIAAVAAASVLAVKYRDTLFGLLDRSPDFTNRADIWHRVAQLALQKPEGWGWVSQWPVWQWPYATIAEFGGHPVTHAHNAYLDVWLQLGVLGAGVFLVLVVRLASNMWRSVERDGWGSPTDMVAWMVLGAILVLTGLTESRLLIEGYWWAFTAAFVVSRRHRIILDGHNVSDRTAPDASTSGKLTYAAKNSNPAGGSTLKTEDAWKRALSNNYPELLETLLFDRTTRRNIIWATNDHAGASAAHQAQDEIAVESVTGEFAGIIAPRTAKSRRLQTVRTKYSGEVFTPAWLCNAQNNLIDGAWLGYEGAFNTSSGQGWCTNRSRVIFAEGGARTWQLALRRTRA